MGGGGGVRLALIVVSFGDSTGTQIPKAGFNDKYLTAIRSHSQIQNMNIPFSRCPCCLAKGLSSSSLIATHALALCLLYFPHLLGRYEKPMTRRRNKMLTGSRAEVLRGE